MGKIRQVVGHLLHELGQPFAANKAIVYIPYFEFYVRGLMIEQSSYKDTYFLRTFCLPQFGADSIVHVSYSPRVTRSRVQDWVGQPKQVAEQVLAWIDEVDFIETLTASYTPIDFVRQFDVEDSSHASTATLFGLAASFLLSGNLQRGDSYLTLRQDNCIQYATRFPPGYALPAAVQALRSALDRSVETASRHLRSECRRNAITLGFLPAPSPAD